MRVSYMLQLLKLGAEHAEIRRDYPCLEQEDPSPEPM